MIADYTFDLSVRWENYKVKFGIKYPKTAKVISMITLVISIIFVALMALGFVYLAIISSFPEPSSTVP